jgi:transposase-like protein
MAAQFTTKGICAMRSDSKNAVQPAQRQPRVVRKRSTAERERLLTLFARSGQTQKRFCHENHVPLSTLTYWLSQVRQRAPEALEGELVEVPSRISGSAHAACSTSPAGDSVDIRLPNRIELRVLAGTDPAWLGELLQGLLTCSG